LIDISDKKGQVRVNMPMDLDTQFSSQPRKSDKAKEKTYIEMSRRADAKCVKIDIQVLNVIYPVK
jgi:hypothetical protein